MATREEFLRHLWTEIINPVFRDSALDNIVSNCKRDPDGPFSDAGPAIERMLAAGICRRDLRLVLRIVRYEGVFGALYSELTLTAMARGDLVAQRKANAAAAKSTAGQRERIEAELSKLASARPAATLKAEIAGQLADPRVGDCRVMDGPRSKAVCPKVAGLRAELGNAERRERLEADLVVLRASAIATAATDKPADPGAHALATYLATIGVSVPATLLTDWLVLVPVLALEIGAALAMVLVQAVPGERQPGVQAAPIAASAAEENLDSRVPAQPTQLQGAPSVTVDSKAPAKKPRSASKSCSRQPPANRRLGQVATVARADAEGKVVDMLKAKGGKLENASVRGIARLINGKKSTVHNAIGTLIATGVVAKVGSELVLAAA